MWRAVWVFGVGERARKGIAFHAPSHSPDVFEHGALEDRPCRKHESGWAGGRWCIHYVSAHWASSAHSFGLDSRSSLKLPSFDIHGFAAWRKICCPASRPFPGEKMFGCYVTFCVLVICWVKSNSSQYLLNVFPIISQALLNINIRPTNHQLFTKILSTHPPPPNIYSIYSQVNIGQSLTKLWCWLILWRDVW